MTDTRELTPGDRRELRSVVKGQFKVLRAEIKRREQEMRAEIEQQLLDRYRAEDDAVAQAREEASRVYADAFREIGRIGRELREKFPDLTVEARKSYDGVSLASGNNNRTQLHRAAMAAIPDRVGDASLALDRQELELLRDLSIGALESGAAERFLNAIPTVGELVPSMRLREIEAALANQTDTP